jgi:cytochrome c oxidase subunit 3
MSGAVHVAHHFPDARVQQHAARMGMWLFLSTEILLFAGLFCGYGFYRFLYPAEFAAASHHLSIPLGALNTVILITSSLTVALAHHSAEHDKSKRAAILLGISILLGLAFMGVKAVEYAHKFHEGALPGRYYHMADLPGAAPAMYFTLYFLMTGIHATHVLVGLGVLGVIAYHAWKGRYSSAYYTPVELGGLYWHIVDLFWIFIFPLLYLF